MITIDVGTRRTQALHDIEQHDSFIATVFEELDKTPCDTHSIPQERLDLAHKIRTSLFPWRGQFSPELVEVLLQEYSKKTSVILDPFVGTGTTIFEALTKDLACYGTEINPSAIEMATTAHFAHIPIEARKQAISQALTIAHELTRPYIWDLFSYEQQHTCEDFDTSVQECFKKILNGYEFDSLVHSILINAIIRYMSIKKARTASDFISAVREHCRIVEQFPYNEKACTVFHADARAIPLSDNSIDLIITSPPYINVFNYHQNNRPAMELAGWNLLEVAKSEIGANRKHRQNRFLTVVQYCLDMLDALCEMRRVLRPDGRAILVIGRESTVRGLSFKNGRIVAAIAIGVAGFRLEARQERKFKNKFGEIIYEDILHLIPDSPTANVDEKLAIQIAQLSLLESAKVATDEQVQSEALQAIVSAHNVQKSPLFQSQVR